MKKILKKIFNFFAYYSGVNHICGFFLNDKIFVLNYHSVINERVNIGTARLYKNLSIDARNFERQIAYLKRRGHTFLKISDLGRLKTERLDKPTVIYFDDGFRDNLLIAAPILEKYSVPATIFVATGLVDRTHFLWTLKFRHIMIGRGVPEREIENKITELKSVTDAERKERMRRDIPGWQNFDTQKFDIFLDWRETKELYKRGWEIGSHGVAHARLTEVSLDDVSRDMTISKKRVEEKVGCLVKGFSYPYGRRNDNTDNMLVMAGYEFVVSGGAGLNNFACLRSQIVILKTVPMRIDKGMAHFTTMLYSRNLLDI